jgi:hypothetical protein
MKEEKGKDEGGERLKKAIIGILLAAIMLASVVSLMVPMGSAVPTFIAADTFSDSGIAIKEKGKDVEINASKGKIVFNMPVTCIIGENLTIKGSASEGDSVDIAVDDIIKAMDIPIENGTFHTEISTVGYAPGSYKIEGFIDGNYSVGEDVSGQESDGSTAILLTSPGLTVNISTNVTYPGGSFVITGTATGTDHVDIITISPDGGNGTGLYEKSYPGVPGITNESIPVENNSFSKTINVSEYATPIPTLGRGGGGSGGVPRDSDGDGITDIDEMLAGTDPNDPCDPNPECAACLATRAYITWVSVPGRDDVYGTLSTAGNASELIKHIIDDYCGGDAGNLRSKTRDQILAILQDATIDTAGSDDLAWVGYLKVEALEIFDTGRPENPYPSIFGTHNGTITPYHDINVSNMYTYPCPGTGGHTEYVAFYNATTGEEIANGTWNGYQGAGDYYYIEFDSPFVLQATVTYNYTIITGSYPQIIHNQTLTNEYGTITCTEFIDANGKKYNSWIPAIRLE